MNGPQLGPSVAALEAWSKSFLSGQDPDVRDALLADSRVASYPAGALICNASNGDYRVALIHSGQIRAQITSWDGRQATTRYLTAGQFTALPAMLTYGAPSSLAAVTSCEVSVLNPNTFRHLLRTRADLCYEVAVHLAESTYETVMHLEDNLFGSVQQRVSRHLLEMATSTVKGLLVQSDQSELADAIGSVREVVSRSLKKLEDTGAIRRSRRQIWIEDPRLLQSFASSNATVRNKDLAVGNTAREAGLKARNE
ncbi:Crp/Fnr family transcriptional regulator [Rhodococcus rhodochrous]|uniref:Crp/Fnr family transcriptional regulator n=1 Tax=Rhodococcus rhodochrous TaxID=1829 RepID=A0AAW4XNU5_RHORH|nr:Crp/Fnr family transcriptional regulator [Rhodococcus rhodochrous]MCD2114901.1 Crp/Fnr family transcriptional regulator [Rhodococcus rhodochrous]TWH44259.1 CRP-like cAMP-binding protein [Rhodococcus rhodochrous J38]